MSRKSCWFIILSLPKYPVIEIQLINMWWYSQHKAAFMSLLTHASFPKVIAYKASKSPSEARRCRFQHTLRSMCLQRSLIKVTPRQLKTPWKVSIEKCHTSEKNYHHSK